MPALSIRSLDASISNLTSSQMGKPASDHNNSNGYIQIIFFPQKRGKLLFSIGVTWGSN
jgi:hypothetical protein